MACNCEGKTINIGMGCCQPVLAPIENYYTKWEVDELIESATTSGCCITPEEVDEKIEEAISGISVSGVTEEELNNAIASAKTEIEAEIPTVPTSNTAFTNDAGYLTEHQSLSGYATEQWVLDKNYITGVDLSNYATKDEIPTVPTKVSAFENDVPYLTEHQSLSGYVTDVEMSAFTYDKATIDEKVASGGTFDPTQYYNKTQTNELVESAVTRVEGEIPSLSGYATEQWVLDKNYITGVDLSDYALKSEIPIVPTSNTAFTNDAGYLTEHQSLSAYSTTDEVNSAITQATSGKANSSDVYLKSETSGATEIQNALNAKADPYSAGTGISIVGNVISATGGGTTYTAGRAIDIDGNNVISFDLPISAGTGTDSLIYNYSGNTASGSYSHAEGRNTIASGDYGAHAEGNSTSASNYSSHAEGSSTVASGSYSHAEGYVTKASGNNGAHAEGWNTAASGESSHAEGINTQAIGSYSHSEGRGTVANNDSEHASGRYNVSNTGSTNADKTLFSVGNGTGNDNRHNAFELRRNGDIYIVSGNTDIKLQDHLGGGVTSGEVQTMIDSSLSGYQEELTAGTNVQINNNVISATDTKYTAGDGISISNQNVISTVTKFWCGTQAEYEQILVKDPNTLYLIHN